MKKLYSILLLGTVAFAGMSVPAHADSLRISYRDGHDDHRRGGWHHGRGHDKHYGYNRGHASRNNVVFISRPPVYRTTYINTTPVYYPAPQPAPYYAGDGYCREYYGPVNIGGRIQQSYGTACLQPDGSWKIID